MFGASLARVGGRAMSRGMGAAWPALLPETNRLLIGMGLPRPAPAHQRAFDTAMRDLKAAGILAKCDMLHVMGQLAANQAKPNWITPGTGDLTFNNNLTFTAKQGVTGDAVSAYASTGRAMNGLSLYRLNDAHVAVWVLTAATESASAVATVTDSTMNLDVRTAGGAIGARLNTGTTTSIAASGSAGFYVMTRSAAAGYDLYRGGSLVQSIVQASTSVPTGTFSYLRGQSVYSSDQVFMGSCGSALTGTEIGNYNTIMVALKAALEAL